MRYTGEVLIDLIFVEKPGEGRVEINFGKTLANLVISVLGFGYEVGFVESVGDDMFGRFFTNSLRMYKVDTRFTVVEKTCTTSAFVVNEKER